MTLGIAIVEDNEVWLMSDTKFTFDEMKSGKKPLYGLKIFYLDRFTSISYATDVAVEVAHQRVFEIYNSYNDSVNFDELVKIICDKFDKSVDFLLARSGDSVAIAKISNGYYAIQRQKGVYWIGNSDAAQFVLKAYNSGLSHLKNKIDDMILSSSYPDIGGYLVVARGSVDGFKFEPSAKLVSPPYSLIENNWQTIDFGTAQSGGFGYTTVIPKEHGVNGWGIFYFQGSYGEYWHVDLRQNIFERLVGRACNAARFTALLAADIGHEVETTVSLG